MNKSFIHVPFMDKKCRECHDQDAASDKNGANSADRTADVNWLSRHFTEDPSHWFVFAAPGGENTIVVEASAMGRKKLVTELTLPPLVELAESPENSQDAPIISNVRVLEVNRGIFFSATIGWETDKLATSQVIYGLERPTISSPMDGQATTNHTVILTTGIKSERTYEFRVVSEDLNGHRSESDKYILSTDKLFSLNPASVQNERSNGVIDLQPKFYRTGDKYTINLIASRPVTMALGMKKQNNPQGRQNDDLKGENHIKTNEQIVTNITTCYTCHRNYKEMVTHPVNVYPKRGMVIPPEYPTLPDGRITCLSCHAEHASNMEYMMLKPHKKELCIGCHADML
ncbi:MAG: cytochrome c3 family protein [Proteobacteria bacterium]|nr:cytochrome c3 family protein [Pseudomonadota bacterium]MBU1686389.1 cytochrome c3 family protein [Pseudomonadota bacterium]